MIDINKSYKTKSGKRVVGLCYKPFNSQGKLVTYPIKGSIVEKEKPLRLRYEIWSENGIVDVVWGKRSSDNLIEA